MKTEDFIDAVNRIHAREELKDKVMSGKPSQNRRRSGFPALAACAACLAVLILGFTFVPKLLKPIGTVRNGESSVNAASPSSYAQPGLVNGLYHQDEVRNLLVLGVDDAGGDGAGRSDCIMLLSIDRRKGSERWILTPFPRDLYVEIPGNGKNKLNAAYQLGGAELSVKTIEQNFKIDVDDYAVIDYSGFVKAVDSLGGIPVNVTAQEADLVNRYSGEPAARDISAGERTLSGRQALYYSRIRQIGGEESRLQRIQAAAAGIISRLESVDAHSLASLTEKLLPFVKTGMNPETALKLGTDAYACRSFPVGYFRPSEELYTAQQVTIQQSNTEVLVPDLEKYQNSLIQYIYWNKGS
ncbi:LCP family protein [Caproiciproducens sp. R1]|uniref:LCP family protein n=1 Tax=Caproiciproducens sp. R1 TaxID=3435000 RepID=UPI0040339B4D